VTQIAAGKFEIVAVASSVGGITALGRVLGALPAGLRVSLLIVQHLDPRHSTVIAGVLSHRSNMPVKLADVGMVCMRWPPFRSSWPRDR